MQKKFPATNYTPIWHFLSFIRIVVDESRNYSVTLSIYIFVVEASKGA